MNSKISVFVLAAGMGSRYGGLKQMEGFGPNGETLIDYSIYDAMKAGFDRIVFVIRPDMEEAFKEIFMSKYEDKIDISYVFQSLDMVPDWYKVNPERTKPWGTTHAVLVAKEALKEPFVIINGDDFYGKEAFEVAAKFLREECKEGLYANIVYRLENVLSDFGGVKRGICRMDDEGFLAELEEHFEVARKEDGTIEGESWKGGKNILKDGDLTSMNMFAVHHSIFDLLERDFHKFLKGDKGELKSEQILAFVFEDWISKGEIKMKALETTAPWFGVTVPDDAPIVREKLKNLVESGEYPKELKV
jgi:NDP-sugar pyrophosphorylase family protein